ncbi:MAG TPA: formate dehydrogenase subunit gamma [Chromatiaceae bacterium]|nr:formate dehydrogenase subunit gamma [Chromatiaceae bacterium]
MRGLVLGMIAGMGLLGRSLLFSFLLIAGLAQAGPEAPPSHDKPSSTVEHPGADYWRFVRQRPHEIRQLEQQGRGGGITTQVRGVDAEVLINQEGERWRQYRAERLVPVSMALVGGVLILLLLTYFLFARRSAAPMDSGRRLLRFDQYERTLHWFMAVLFLFLGITGLLLLYGRPLLIPWMGKEAFSVLASASKEGHNVMGPLFLISILLFAARFWHRNLYERGDFIWLLKGGGFIGRAHPRAGFFNMGEKILFWAVVLVGLAISLSGMVLLFPNFGQGRLVMEGAHLVHTLGAVMLILVIMGHIFMAVAVKGTMDGMNSGYSELNWAKAHHSRWAEQQEARGQLFSSEELRRKEGDVPVLNERE